MILFICFPPFSDLKPDVSEMADISPDFFGGIAILEEIDFLRRDRPFFDGRIEIDEILPDWFPKKQWSILFRVIRNKIKAEYMV